MSVSDDVKALLKNHSLKPVLKAMIRQKTKEKVIEAMNEAISELGEESKGPSVAELYKKSGVLGDAVDKTPPPEQDFRTDRRPRR